MTRIQKPKKPKQIQRTNRVPLRSLNINQPRLIRNRSSRAEMTAIEPIRPVHTIGSEEILNLTNTAESTSSQHQQEDIRLDRENFERQLEAAHQVRG